MALLALASFQSNSQAQIIEPSEKSRYADKQQVTNPKTGKVERVFVDLEAVYPNPSDPDEEMSFEELRAFSRGWLNRDWREKSNSSLHTEKLSAAGKEASSPSSIFDESENILIDDGSEHNALLPHALEDETRPGRSGKPRKTKVMEVNVETQTSRYP